MSGKKKNERVVGFTETFLMQFFALLIVDAIFHLFGYSIYDFIVSINGLGYFATKYNTLCSNIPILPKNNDFGIYMTVEFTMVFLALTLFKILNRIRG